MTWNNIRQNRVNVIQNGKILNRFEDFTRILEKKLRLMLGCDFASQRASLNFVKRQTWPLCSGTGWTSLEASAAIKERERRETEPEAADITHLTSLRLLTWSQSLFTRSHSLITDSHFLHISSVSKWPGVNSVWLLKTSRNLCHKRHHRKSGPPPTLLQTLAEQGISHLKQNKWVLRSFIFW